MTMGFGRGGINRKRKPQEKHHNKNKRVAARLKKEQKEGAPKTVSPAAKKEVKLSERKETGLVEVGEKEIRAYIAVAYAIRFDEPPPEEWNDITTTISEELCRFMK